MQHFFQALNLIERCDAKVISLGILTLHPHVESNYATTMAKQSKKYGISVFRFHPHQWDAATNLVKGKQYDDAAGTWKDCTFPLPEYIYDRCYYSYRHQLDEYITVKKLKQKADFLSTGLPNKWSVFQTLKRHPSLRPFLPKTAKVSSTEAILSQLAIEKKLVLKPLWGAHGKGIFFLKKAKHAIAIHTHHSGSKITKTMPLKHFKRWLHTINAAQNYMMQSFLPLMNDRNEPFDVRILVQKNRQGKWQETGRGLRIGKQGNYVSNLHNGGKIISFNEWLLRTPPVRKHRAMKQLDAIIALLPPLLEKRHGPLFEIGIDVGIDQSGNCWVLEANSKPGYRTILKTTNKKLFERPLQYCLYLHRLKSKGVAQR